LWDAWTGPPPADYLLFGRHASRLADDELSR
jgi:hypothetical protein